MKIYHKNECKRNFTESAVLVLKINNGFWMRHRYDSVHVLLFKVFYWIGEEKRARKAIWDCWLEWFCPDLNGVTQIASSANCILPRSQCLFHLYSNHHLLHLLSLVSYPSQTKYHASDAKVNRAFDNCESCLTLKAGLPRPLLTSDWILTPFSVCQQTATISNQSNQRL